MKNRRIGKLTTPTSRSLRWCHQRLMRFPMPVSWKLSACRAVLHASPSNPASCRSSDRPAETTRLLKHPDYAPSHYHNLVPVNYVLLDRRLSAKFFHAVISCNST